MSVFGPHHEVNLLFPEQWQKGCLFSFINACVARQMEVWIFAEVPGWLWRKLSVMLFAHLHHSSASEM